MLTDHQKGLWESLKVRWFDGSYIEFLDRLSEDDLVEIGKVLTTSYIRERYPQLVKDTRLIKLDIAIDMRHVVTGASDVVTGEESMGADVGNVSGGPPINNVMHIPGVGYMYAYGGTCTLMGGTCTLLGVPVRLWGVGYMYASGGTCTTLQ